MSEHTQVEDRTPYVYVLVRSDLSHSQQVVQTTHSCLESSRLGLIPHNIQHPHLVVCRVNDHAQLLKEAERCRYKGIRLTVFTEPDLPACQETAFCTEPIYGKDRRFFQRYQLLRSSEEV